MAGILAEVIFLKFSFDDFIFPLFLANFEPQ